MMHTIKFVDIGNKEQAENLFLQAGLFIHVIHSHRGYWDYSLIQAEDDNKSVGIIYPHRTSEPLHAFLRLTELKECRADWPKILNALGVI